VDKAEVSETRLLLAGRLPVFGAPRGSGAAATGRLAGRRRVPGGTHGSVSRIVAREELG
jgi:hypothetical protein